MATINKAIQWLKEKKGIKRANWKIDGEVHLILSRGVIRDCYGERYRFDWDDLTATNWMVYEK